MDIESILLNHFFVFLRRLKIYSGRFPPLTPMENDKTVLPRPAEKQPKTQKHREEGVNGYIIYLYIYRLIRPSHTIYHSVRIARFTERKVKNRNSLSGNSFADIHLDELKAYLLENVNSSNTLSENCIVLLMREAAITTRTITKANDLHSGGIIAHLCNAIPL